MLFYCPKCKNQLELTDRTYKCSNGHCYDIARQGYVNLLAGSAGGVHGDDDIMLASRRRFLEAGFYDRFADKLCKLVKKFVASDEDAILDCGCGEGYYTAKLHSMLPENPIAAYDVSKKAVAMAASKYKGIDFAVASSRDIPVKDNFVKILTNVFSPMEHVEFWRILKNDGILIYAVPGAKHLWGLKQAIYEVPYENKVQNAGYDGFELMERVSVKDKITIDSSLLLDLFAMTPYYYRSPKGAKEKLQHISEMRTEIEFDFLVYKKS